MENKITERLDSAIEVIEEMKEMILNGDEDAPLAFLEAAQEVQDHMGWVLHTALLPILRGGQGSETVKVKGN